MSTVDALFNLSSSESDAPIIIKIPKKSPQPSTSSSSSRRRKTSEELEDEKKKKKQTKRVSSVPIKPPTDEKDVGTRHHHHKQATTTRRQIQKAQKSDRRIFAAAPIARVIRRLIYVRGGLKKDSPNESKYHVSADMLNTAIYAGEAFTLHVATKANKLAEHAKRETIKHIDFVKLHELCPEVPAAAPLSVLKGREETMAE